MKHAPHYNPSTIFCNSPLLYKRSVSSPPPMLCPFTNTFGTVLLPVI